MDLNQDLKNSKNNRILLAFSGGLDTSAIVPWLKEQYQAEVIAYCSDLGNAPDEAYLRDWALKLGASELIYEDLKERFASEFAFPAVRASAIYQDDYLLGTALARPLISERIAHFAVERGATAIAHGATGKGNDHLRFERSWAYLVPEIPVIAPWRIWEYQGRADLLAYLAKRGFHLESAEKKYSVDVNLFHRSCEGGVLEDPSQSYDPSEIYEWVKPPGKYSSDSYTVEVEFQRGLPVKLDGKALGSATLLTRLNDIAGEAGVGVQDIVESRANGIKSRGVYETPGGTVLHRAMQSLKHICWDRTLMNSARSLAVQYAELVYDGLWHTDTRDAMDAFFSSAAQSLNGKVKLKLEQGTLQVLSRESGSSLYDADSVTFEEDDEGINRAADGYSKISCLAHQKLGKRDLKSGCHPFKSKV